MRTGVCEYGGIESISKCAGGDGKGICADAIFSSKNKEGLLKLKNAHEEEIANLSPDSMRYGSLKQEIYAIEVYQDVINR